MQLAEAYAECAALRQALQFYGSHRETCPGIAGCACECGLYKAQGLGIGARRLQLERDMLQALRDATDRYGPRTPGGRRIRKVIAKAEAAGL